MGTSRSTLISYGEQVADYFLFNPIAARQEMAAAGIPKKLASTIGIVVDHPCRNRLLEGLQADVLKTYKANFISCLNQATQVHGAYMPVACEKPSVDLIKITKEMKPFNAYSKLRVERANENHIGARMKSAALKLQFLFVVLIIICSTL
ncbi:60S ribosomal protein L13-like [Solanum verrucosum]|uniref:60S ribosomal protein L13-like n=1 Tax=Solanum verrucosum TaxID=315347 RepID=UPI0020D0300C|nr:60S ribosomal protein L13-like [Solanum verrucosum]